MKNITRWSCYLYLSFPVSQHTSLPPRKIAETWNHAEQTHDSETLAISVRIGIDGGMMITIEQILSRKLFNCPTLLPHYPRFCRFLNALFIRIQGLEASRCKIWGSSGELKGKGGQGTLFVSSSVRMCLHVTTIAISVFVDGLGFGLETMVFAICRALTGVWLSISIADHEGAVKEWLAIINITYSGLSKTSRTQIEQDTQRSPNRVTNSRWLWSYSATGHRDWKLERRNYYPACLSINTVMHNISFLFVLSRCELHIRTWRIQGEIRQHPSPPSLSLTNP